MKISGTYSGRIGIISSDEYQQLKMKVTVNDMLGKEGIEKALEPYLKGEDGHRIVEQSVTGELQGNKQYTSTSGHNVILTIDSELQKLLKNLAKISKD